MYVKKWVKVNMEVNFLGLERVSKRQIIPKQSKNANFRYQIGLQANKDEREQLLI